MNLFSVSFFEDKLKTCVTLVLVTFVLYFKSFYYDFSPFDDQWLILKNTDTLKDWGNLGLIFSKPLAGLYYRPVLNLTLMLDYHLGEVNPAIYHFSNVFYQAICVLVLFSLLKEFAINQKLAFVLALIFAVHPIMLHSVAWVPGRNDILLSLFGIGSLLFLVKYLKQGKLIFLFAHFVFFVIALFTKENAFLFLAFFVQVLLLYKSPVKKTIVLLGINLVLVLIWFYIRQNIVNQYPGKGTGLGSTFLNFGAGFLMFIGKTGLPWYQSVFPTLNTALVITGLFVLLAYLYAFKRFGSENKKIVLLGLFIFFVMLAIPVWYGASSSTGEHYEHRAHTAMAGLLICFSQLKINTFSKWFNILSGGLILVFSTKTFYRMDVYKTQMAFLDNGISEGSRYYHFYFQKGNLEYYDKKFDSALENYNKSIELQARTQSFFNRGNVYVELGKKNEAIADYTKAYELSGHDPFILLTRCMTYDRFNDPEAAVNDLVYLKKCCQDMIPKKMEAGIISNWNKKQLADINALIAKEPGNALLYVNRAKMYMDRRMGREALEDLRKACELEPGNTEFKRYFNELNNSLPK